MSKNLKMATMLLLSLVSGCGIENAFSPINKHYDVKFYSGGKLIRHDQFYGNVTYNRTTNKTFYMIHDTLRTITGDCEVNSWR